MFTQNYYDFNERNNLNGTLLDILKENVYLIDEEEINYKEKIVLAIKENYNIEVEFVEVESFDELKIYKTVCVLDK